MPLIDRKSIRHTIYSYLHHRRVIVTSNGTIEDPSILKYPNYRHTEQVITMVPIIDLQNPYSCFVFRFSGSAKCNQSQVVPDSGNSIIGSSEIVAISGFNAEENIHNFSFSHLWKEKDTGIMLQLRESVAGIIQDFFTGDVAMSDTTWSIFSSILETMGLEKLSSNIMGLRQIFINSKIVFPEKELKIYDGVRLNSSNSYTVEKIYITKNDSDMIYSEIIKDITDLDLWPKVFYISPKNQGEGCEPPILKAYRAKKEGGEKGQKGAILYEALKKAYVAGYVLLGYYFFSYFDDLNIPDEQYPKAPTIVEVLDPIINTLPRLPRGEEQEGYLTEKYYEMIKAHCFYSTRATLRDDGDCVRGCVGLAALVLLESALNGNIRVIETIRQHEIKIDNENSSLWAKAVELYTDIVIAGYTALGRWLWDEMEKRLGTRLIGKDEKHKEKGESTAVTIRTFRPVKHNGKGGTYQRVTYKYDLSDPLGESGACVYDAGKDPEIKIDGFLNRIARYLFFPAKCLVGSNKDDVKAIVTEILNEVNSKYSEYVATWVNNQLTDGGNDQKAYIEKFVQFLKIAGEGRVQDGKLVDPPLFKPLANLANLQYNSYADIVKALGPVIRDLVATAYSMNVMMSSACVSFSSVSNDILAFFRALIIMPPSSYSFIPYFTEYVRALYEGLPYIKINENLYTIGYYGIVLLNAIRNTPSSLEGIQRSIYYLLPEEVDVQFSNSFVYDMGLNQSTAINPHGRPLWAKLKITFRPINEYIHLYGNFIGLHKLLELLGDSEISEGGGGGTSGSGAGSTTVSNSGSSSSSSSSSGYTAPVVNRNYKTVSCK